MRGRTLSIVVLLLIAISGAAISGCGRDASRTSIASHRAPRQAAAISVPPASGGLYVNPDTPALSQARVWRATGDARDARAVLRIAVQPTAVWLTGNESPRAAAARLVAAAAQANGIAQLVLYDIPDRDCQSYSAGGARSAGEYERWIDQVAQGLGTRRVIVVVEPDAIDQAASGCISPDQALARYQLLAAAVTRLKSDPRARVYLDAGHAGWLSPAQLDEPLLQSGIAQADGFALNVANFQTTQASIAYGTELSRELGGKHFVIDTGRNGAGPPPGSGGGVDQWCNPRGRALGSAPTLHTGVPLVDGFLWVKYPGESDGACSLGDPPAGVWWPQYALGLVDHTPATAAASGHPAAAAGGQSAASGHPAVRSASPSA
ncbi:MAG: glycoside hydrolase family 6 protein [Solirubrobacterales bacterium]|nr:glycoside hydrolase family 6 protein [Solirubrobacterales bacterium]